MIIHRHKVKIQKKKTSLQNSTHQFIFLATAKLALSLVRNELLPVVGRSLYFRPRTKLCVLNASLFDAIEQMFNMMLNQ